MNGEEIAIVGISCRFPGASNPREFWSNLIEGRQSITFLSDEEKLTIDNHHISKHNHYVPCKGGLLENVDIFDAPFFKYSPKEAELMDPQMRIFHETVWEALEDAGYVPGRYKGRIGLYAGASDNIHWKNHILFSDSDQTRDNLALSLLIDRDHIFTKIAYALNLTGPCYALQTACSTSLVAVHVASQALLNGECDMAMAGGVSIHYGFDEGYTYQDGSILSPDGYCRAFDANAKGTIPGSGSAVVVLKVLERAIRDRDSIYAVIKGSAINNDGNQKTGYTSPSVVGQSKVIRDALTVAEVDPRSISYIEAHGTGTSLGDPIEIEALKEIYGKSDSQYCGIGSVKTNIGHLDVAAGVAGLIKTALALKFKKIPQTLNFSSLNPRIVLSDSSFFVADEAIDLSDKSGPLRAGVSSFGIGGTNAHIILESFEESKSPKKETDRAHLVVLSAKTPSALEEGKKLLQQYIADTSDPIGDIAYTLAVGREKFPLREVFVASSNEELRKKLADSNPQSRKVRPDVIQELEIIFLFSGQGSQYCGMCAELYKHEPLFKTYLDRGFDVYRSITGEDFRPLMLEQVGGNSRGVNDPLQETIKAQPSLFILEYAMVEFLMDLGVRPVNMIGHSVGEYVAACIAGVFSYEDGLRIIVKRAELMQRMSPGAMLSVAASELELRACLKDNVNVSAINGPKNCVLSGPTEELQRTADELKIRGYASTFLNTSHAFHSEMMEPMLKEFENFLSTFNLALPVRPFISNLTGVTIQPERAAEPGYWIEHLRHTVQFSAGVDLLCNNYQNGIFVEIGPGNALSSLVRKSGKANASHLAVSLIKPASEKQSAHAYFIGSLGALWKNDVAIDLEKLFKHQDHKRVHLPTYGFDQHQFNATISWRSIGEIFNEKLATRKAPQPNDIFHIPYWKQPVELTYRFPKQKKLNWLVFSNNVLPDEQLQKTLDDFAINTVLITAGLKFEEVEDGKFVINPTEREDYVRLLTLLRSRDILPDFIVHGWVVDPTANAMSSFSRIAKCMKLGVESLTCIAQAYGVLGITKATFLGVMTSESINVTGNDCHFPEYGMLSGLAKIIGVEYSNIECKVFDVILTELLNKEKHLLKLLFTQMMIAHKEVTIALRGERIWVQDFKPVVLGEEVSDTMIKQHGTYMITGGSGGMALHIAKYLTETYQANVILVSRSNLSELSPLVGQNIEMGQFSDNGKNGNGRSNTYGKIVFFQADVSDLNRMKKIVEEWQRKYGVIDGVLHAAATIDSFGVIQKRKRDDFEASMRAKVHGALVLFEIFKEVPPDFIVLFSSGGTISYGTKYGEAGYVMSNEFLDVLAGYSDGPQDTLIKTINWSDWSGVGMSVKAIDNFYQDDIVAKEAAVALFEKEALTPDEGIKAFSKIMSNTVPRIAISKHSLEGIHIDVEEDRGKKQKFFLEGKVKSKQALRRSDVDEKYVEPGDQLQKQIASVWEDYFGYSKISVHENIFELGANSLDLSQINGTLKTKLKIDIPLVTLFEYPTIDKLVKYLNGTSVADDQDFAERIQEGKSKIHKIKSLPK